MLVPTQDGRYLDEKGREKFAFRKGDVLFRRGTQSIPATPKEQAWIAQRAKMAGYQLGVLSGLPDLVEETLLSDMFPVTRMPTHVYVAELREKPPREALALTDYKYERPNIYCFTNPQEGPLADSIRGKVKVARTPEWVKDPENSRRMTWMLGDLLQNRATMRGISVQRKPRKLYYRMAKDVKERSVPWRGIQKPATKQVAHRSYVAALSREVAIHEAIQPRFIELDGDYFLQLRPTKVITEDGGDPSVGDEEGRVITSFGADNTNFNKAQLRWILFWAYQLESSPGRILMGSSIEISTRPVETKVLVGIRQDLPVSLATLDDEEGGDTDAAIPSSDT